MAFDLFRVVEVGAPGTDRWPGVEPSGALDVERFETVLGRFPALWALGGFDRKQRLVKHREDWRIDATVTDRRLVFVNQRFDAPILGSPYTDTSFVMTQQLVRVSVGHVRWDWVTELLVEPETRKGVTFGFRLERDPFETRGATHLIGTVPAEAATDVSELLAIVVRHRPGIDDRVREAMVDMIVDGPVRLDLGEGRRPPRS